MSQRHKGPNGEICGKKDENGELLIDNPDDYGDHYGACSMVSGISDSQMVAFGAALEPFNVTLERSNDGRIINIEASDFSIEMKKPHPYHLVVLVAGILEYVDAAQERLYLGNEEYYLNNGALSDISGEVDDSDIGIIVAALKIFKNFIGLDLRGSHVTLEGEVSIAAAFVNERKIEVTSDASSFSIENYINHPILGRIAVELGPMPDDVTYPIGNSATVIE